MVGDIYRDHLTPLGSHTATFCCFQAARDEIVDDEEEIRDPDEVHGGLDGGSEVRGDEEGGSHRSPPNVLSPLPTTRRVGDPLVDEDYEDGEDDEDDDDPFLSIPTAGGSANGRRTVSRCSVVVEIRYPQHLSTQVVPCPLVRVLNGPKTSLGRSPQILCARLRTETVGLQSQTGRSTFHITSKLMAVVSNLLQPQPPLLFPRLVLLSSPISLKIKMEGRCR